MAQQVVYLGPLTTKTISAAKWLQITGEVVSSTTWNTGNSFSLASSAFTAAQLRYLESRRDFTKMDTTRPIDFVPVDDIPDNIQAYLETKLAADRATYAAILPAVATYTYNPDGSVATETVGGATTTYTYNGDGTVATATRGGVTRTFTYTAGNVTAVA